MELKRIPIYSVRCSSCFDPISEVAILYGKSFYGMNTCLCRGCFNKLKDLVNNFSFEDDTASEMDEENLIPHSGPEC